MYCIAVKLFVQKNARRITSAGFSSFLPSYLIINFSNEKSNYQAKRQKRGERRKPERPARRAYRPPPFIARYYRYKIRNPYFRRQNGKHDKKYNQVRFVFQLRYYITQ